MLTTCEERGTNADALLFSEPAGTNGTRVAELPTSGLNADALLLRGVRVLSGVLVRMGSCAAGDFSSILGGL
jgi:hypothetical protein